MVTIYALTCTTNGKAYIGCTAGKIAKRFREHRCMLNLGTHSEPDLLADWRLYGQAMFCMETVMELENDAPSVPSGKPFADSPTPKHRRNPRGVYAFLAR